MLNNSTNVNGSKGSWEPVNCEMLIRRHRKHAAYFGAFYTANDEILRHSSNTIFTSTSSCPEYPSRFNAQLSVHVFLSFPLLRLLPYVSVWITASTKVAMPLLVVVFLLKKGIGYSNRGICCGHPCGSVVGGFELRCPSWDGVPDHVRPSASTRRDPSLTELVMILTMLSQSPSSSLLFFLSSLFSVMRCCCFSRPSHRHRHQHQSAGRLAGATVRCPALWLLLLPIVDCRPALQPSPAPYRRSVTAITPGHFNTSQSKAAVVVCPTGQGTAYALSERMKNTQQQRRQY